MGSPPAGLGSEGSALRGACVKPEGGLILEGEKRGLVAVRARLRLLLSLGANVTPLAPTPVMITLARKPLCWE